MTPLSPPAPKERAPRPPLGPAVGGPRGLPSDARRPRLPLHGPPHMRRPARMPCAPIASPEGNQPLGALALDSDRLSGTEVRRALAGLAASRSPGARPASPARPGPRCMMETISTSLQQLRLYRHALQDTCCARHTLCKSIGISWNNSSVHAAAPTDGR